MPTISIDVGNGLTFDDNKLTTNWVDDSNVTKSPNGIIVGDMNEFQMNRTISTVDNETLVESNNGVSINRDKVQCIFAMSCWKVESRSPYNYTINQSLMKTKEDVIEEMNILIDEYNHTCYNMNNGDLLMFRHQPVPLMNDTWSYTSDNGLRDEHTPCIALFVVTDISYSDKKVSDINLKCLWYDDNSLHGLTNGSYLI